MNALSHARRAYSDATAPTRTARGIEYEALARITKRLRIANAQGVKGFNALVSALHDNRKIWNIFAMDVAQNENPLPHDLKARLFYLSEFTTQHTSKVLARQASVEPLLDINTAILRGLRGGAK